MRVSYGVWAASSGRARPVQTDLERGFGHAGVGNWDTLGSVVLIAEWTVCRHIPLVPAATGGGRVLSVVSCWWWQLSVSQSVSQTPPALSAALAGRLAVWNIFGPIVFDNIPRLVPGSLMMMVFGAFFKLC